MKCKRYEYRVDGSITGVDCLTQTSLSQLFTPIHQRPGRLSSRSIVHREHKSQVLIPWHLFGNVTDDRIDELEDVSEKVREYFPSIPVLRNRKIQNRAIHWTRKSPFAPPPICITPLSMSLRPCVFPKSKYHVPEFLATIWFSRRRRRSGSYARYGFTERWAPDRREGAAIQSCSLAKLYLS